MGAQDYSGNTISATVHCTRCFTLCADGFCGTQKWRTTKLKPLFQHDFVCKQTISHSLDFRSLSLPKFTIPATTEERFAVFQNRMILGTVGNIESRLEKISVYASHAQIEHWARALQFKRHIVTVTAKILYTTWNVRTRCIYLKITQLN